MGGIKKYQLKRALAIITKVKTWQLIIIVLLLCFLDATFLRLDHIKMLNYREAVITADKEGNSEEIQLKLSELQSFTLKHIVINEVEENGSKHVVFGTGPLYLENEYVRKATEALNKAQSEADQGNQDYGNVFKEVAEICDALGRQYGWYGYADPDHGYLNCFVDELAKRSSGQDTRPISSQANLPSTELFRYDFASPIWYPCLSGIFILITLILTIIIVIRILIWIGLRIAIAVVK